MGGVTAAEAKEATESPTEFLATTVNVTAVPPVNPVSVAVRTLPTVTAVPADGVTVYPVIAAPPFISGAAHVTVAELIPATAETSVGASGTVFGVTEVDAEEDTEEPAEFIATTVNVKGVPLVKLVKLAVKTFSTDTGSPTDGVTVYAVIVAPPFEAGAVQVTVAEALPATAETVLGALGAVAGITGADKSEATELPMAFFAITVNVIAVPLVNPLIVAVKTLPTFSAVPMDGVTVYPVIAEPPSEDGAVHDTVAKVFPATAKMSVGASATVAGVIGAEGEEGKELSTEFIACTVNVTGVPLVRLLYTVVKTLPTSIEVPSDDVTKYPVIAEVPLEAGATHETVAD